MGIICTSVTQGCWVCTQGGHRRVISAGILGGAPTSERDPPMLNKSRSLAGVTMLDMMILGGVHAREGAPEAGLQAAASPRCTSSPRGSTSLGFIVSSSLFELFL
eukprot:1158316-Pelagomonas_calceolata.AAC.7